MTVITSMIESIRKAALYNRHELAPPRVILWPDEDRFWMEAIDLLRASFPLVVVAGGLRPRQGHRSGSLAPVSTGSPGWRGCAGDLSARHRAGRLPQC
jgi:hypothetical protein